MLKLWIKREAAFLQMIWYDCWLGENNPRSVRAFVHYQIRCFSLTCYMQNRGK